MLSNPSSTTSDVAVGGGTVAVAVSSGGGAIYVGGGSGAVAVGVTMVVADFACWVLPHGALPGLQSQRCSVDGCYQPLTTI